MSRQFPAFLLILLLAGCVAPGPTPTVEPPPPAREIPLQALPEAMVVPERFLVEGYDHDELDSLATWLTPEGQVWIIASAKRSHQLLVLDGSDGSLLQRVGGPGEGVGEFDRPNGVAVHGDMLFVVERDNRRVQMLELPGFVPIAAFGDDVLQAPYGMWLHEPAPGQMELVVTDSFMDGEDHAAVPPVELLDRRLHRFEIDLAELPGRAGGVVYRGSFGGTTEATAVRITESVGGDPLYDRLLVADEDTDHGARIRVYRLGGGHTGPDIGPGVFRGEPEGIALWACPDGSGYWIVADQRPERTGFLVFGRRHLDLLAQFTGQTTAETDGIVLHASGNERFPMGVLYAVHRDRGVAAFDWRDIAQTLELSQDCGV